KSQAPATNAQPQAPKRRRTFATVLREFAIIVICALVLSALVRAFVLQAFYVPSASMEQTLLPSDRIIAAKLTTKISGVRRGEVVVFRDPGGWLPVPDPQPGGWEGFIRDAATFVGLLPSESGQDLVKRVIAVGGDRIACCDSQGRIVLNGISLDEPYLNGSTDQVRFDVTLPQQTLFVMGDNRGDSRDSRFHLTEMNGGVPIDDVVGRAFLIAYPSERFSDLPVPSVFDNPALGTAPQ
ncbi:MAG: signal peptidase I, partial [Actinomycetales bacterium]